MSYNSALMGMRVKICEKYIKTIKQEDKYDLPKVRNIFHFPVDNVYSSYTETWSMKTNVENKCLSCPVQSFEGWACGN